MGKREMVWAIFCRASIEDNYGYFINEDEARAKCKALNEQAKQTAWAEGRKCYHIEQIVKPYWL